jgi:hypothetical protein
MEVDTLRSMVISVEWTSQDEHINILSLSTTVVLGFLRLGYRPVIVVDTFSGDKLSRYLADLKRTDETLAVRAFALVTKEKELKRRLEHRPPDRFKDFDVSQKLNADVINHLHPSEIIINTSASAPEKTANEIHDLLNHR